MGSALLYYILLDTFFELILLKIHHVTVLFSVVV